MLLQVLIICDKSLLEDCHVSQFVPPSDNQNESPVLKSDQPIESLIPRTPRSGCFPSLIAATQALLCSILALTSGLVLLLAGPDCPHSSGSCSLLVYLDPAFSLVAVIVLLAIALPQVRRCYSD